MIPQMVFFYFIHTKQTSKELLGNQDPQEEIKE